MEGKPIIETICEGGAGGEASILVQARNFFPGIGGPIISEQVVATAFRQEYSSVPGTGARLFLKHVIIKKLDDYFCRINVYSFPHIARPLGSIGKNGNGDDDNGKKEEKESYLYEWVVGSESFPWEQGGADGDQEPVSLDEWNPFSDFFDGAGIGVSGDVTDAENGTISQNIIHQLCRGDALKLNRFWKRIDFGDRSLHIDHEKLARFLQDKGENIKAVLGRNRFELMLLAQAAISGKKLSDRDKGKLEILAREYRLSTLRHHQPKIVIQ